MMTITLYPHTIIYFFSALLALALALAAWLQRKVAGGTLLALFMLSSTVWLFGLAMESAVPGLDQKIRWSGVEYIGFSNAAPLIFQFALVYTHRKWPPYLVALLWVVPILNILMAWTNAVHGLLWTDFIWRDTELNLLQYVHGPWHTFFVGYFSLLILAASVLFFFAWQQATGLEKRKYILLILASLIPLLSGFLYVANWFPLQVLNLIPIGCIISNLLIWYIMKRYRLLDLGPIARIKLIENLPDGVIVIDNDHQIFSANPAAKRILGGDLQPGQPAPSLQFTCADPENNQMIEFRHPHGHLLHLKIDHETLRDRQAKNIGTLFVLRDLTKFHQTEIELRDQIRSETARQERQQMARDLHDSIVQSLHSAYLLTDNLKRLLGQMKTPQSDRLIEGISASVRQALREMRLMIYQRNTDDEKLDFISGLKDRLLSVEERVGFQIELNLDPNLNLSPIWEPDLSAITSEALNNIIKHADASEIKISLLQENGLVQLCIQDNGRGFNPEKVGPGRMGLKNMQARTDRLRAVLKVHSFPEKGTQIRLDIPLPVSEGEHDD